MVQCFFAQWLAAYDFSKSLAHSLHRYTSPLAPILTEIEMYVLFISARAISEWNSEKASGGPYNDSRFFRAFRIQLTFWVPEYGLSLS